MTSELFIWFTRDRPMVYGDVTVNDQNTTRRKGITRDRLQVVKLMVRFWFETSAA